ncbi:MAG: hypothetical protein HQ568_07925 [Calditrichaeota bacterium]|nr:hypothetical protein [Calditrichota bacterium]
MDSKEKQANQSKSKFADVFFWIIGTILIVVWLYLFILNQEILSIVFVIVGILALPPVSRELEKPPIWLIWLKRLLHIVIIVIGCIMLFNYFWN